MNQSFKKQLPFIGMVICMVLVFSGCAQQPYPVSYAPGFFTGLWHGIIAPFALIGSIFVDIRVYEFPNSGFWYDFGFVLGIGGLSWGGSRF